MARHSEGCTDIIPYIYYVARHGAAGPGWARMGSAGLGAAALGGDWPGRASQGMAKRGLCDLRPTSWRDGLL